MVGRVLFAGVVAATLLLPAAASAQSKPATREPGTGRAAACRTNAQCETGWFCFKPEGRCDWTGSCAPRPEVCTQLYKPVCGCDGKTYSNGCMAAMAGVSVARRGRCRPEPKPRTDLPRCMTNAECPEEQYCAKPMGKCKEEGACAPRPKICPDLHAPVCGCDGKTYDNRCRAAAAGTSARAHGECPPGTKPIRPASPESGKAPPPE